MPKVSTLHFAYQYILRPANRGLLLDITVFLLNLFLMGTLLSNFVELIQAAVAGEPIAQIAMFGFCVALFVLPPFGATLKRWHYHKRLLLRGTSAPGDEKLGCLFNPIFFFCLNVVIFATINAFVMEAVFGRGEENGGIFVSSIFVGMILIILNTYLVYRYFSPPKKEPEAIFLRDPRFEVVGDAAVFIYMIFFQLIWNLLTLADIARVASVTDFFGRLFILIFLALLIYFPPRMFYLAEDIGKRRTWITILLANAPIIYRFIIGTNIN